MITFILDEQSFYELRKETYNIYMYHHEPVGPVNGVWVIFIVQGFPNSRAESSTVELSRVESSRAEQGGA